MSARPAGPCTGRFIGGWAGICAADAEAVFTAHLEMGTAVDFYKDLKSRAKAQGRDPDGVVILPGFSPIIAGTESEAKKIAQELDELADVEVGRKRLTGRFATAIFPICRLTGH